MLYKDTGSQKIAVFAYTASTGAAKTGDAANITAYISKDFGSATATNDVNPTELDATNMPGWYVFDLTQAETNAEVIVLAPKSGTSGVVLDQLQVFTQYASLSTLATPAQVNAEMVDALSTDTYAEPGQGAPAATASLAAKVNYLYKAWRNKKTQTATTASLYNDAGDTVDQKSTDSDDGTTFTKGEMVSGA